MKKILGFTWLLIVAAALIMSIYGGASLAQNQKQNRTLGNKIDQLTQKIDQLEAKINQPGQVAAASSENGSQPTSEPKAKPRSKPFPSTRALASTPTPSPTPTPISTPTPIPKKLVTVEIQTLASYKVELQENDTAFSVLLKAAQDNNFTVDYTIYEGLGAFVNCIAGICGHDSYYWAFYYNGQYSQVGASSLPVSDGDITIWKFETW
jgi:outer membrane murein-binding lipoprotein Lpp